MPLAALLEAWLVDATPTDDLTTEPVEDLYREADDLTRIGTDPIEGLTDQESDRLMDAISPETVHANEIQEDRS